MIQSSACSHRNFNIIGRIMGNILMHRDTEMITDHQLNDLVVCVYHTVSRWDENTWQYMMDNLNVLETVIEACCDNYLSYHLDLWSAPTRKRARR